MTGGFLGLCFSFPLLGSKARAVLRHSSEDSATPEGASGLAGSTNHVHKIGVHLITTSAASSPFCDIQGRRNQRVSLVSELVGAVESTTTVGVFRGGIRVPRILGSR